MIDLNIEEHWGKNRAPRDAASDTGAHSWGNSVDHHSLLPAAQPIRDQWVYLTVNT